MKLICIPAIKSHVKYVGYSLNLLIEQFPDADFMLVTPDRESFSGLRKSNISIRDDTEFLDLSRDDVKRKLAHPKKSMYKWYYQQFLKYSIISKSTKYAEVLIVDADTLILSDCVKAGDALNLTTLEYNESYFEIVKKYFPEQRLLPKSSIVNFMWFNSVLFGDMLKSIEGNSKRKWFEVILEDVNKTMAPCAFSEYETYANYKFNNKKTALNTLKIFRRGDLLMGVYSFEKIIKVANSLKLDVISFEDTHDNSLWKKFTVCLLFFAIELYLLPAKLFNSNNKISSDIRDK